MLHNAARGGGGKWFRAIGSPCVIRAEQLSARGQMLDCNIASNYPHRKRFTSQTGWSLWVVRSFVRTLPNSVPRRFYHLKYGGYHLCVTGAELSCRERPRAVCKGKWISARDVFLTRCNDIPQTQAYSETVVPQKNNTASLHNWATILGPEKPASRSSNSYASI